MFFAETLGPVLTGLTGQALSGFVTSRLRGRKAVSIAELHEIVSEFVQRDGGRLPVNTAIEYLAARGVIDLRDAA